MKKEISLDEEMLMFTSYRYCIGRQTYVTSLAPYIGKKYYPLLNDERAEHTAKDIRNCIADVLNYGSLTFRYDGTVMHEQRDAFSDFLTWLNDNVENEKDLIGVDTIECYKEDYKPDSPKKFFVTKKKHYELPKYETDFSDLLEWHKLSSLFDRKSHVKVWVNYEGKEELVDALADVCAIYVSANITTQLSSANCIQQCVNNVQTNLQQVDNVLTQRLNINFRKL